MSLALASTLAGRGGITVRFCITIKKVRFKLAWRKRETHAKKKLKKSFFPLTPRKR